MTPRHYSATLLFILGILLIGCNATPEASKGNAKVLVMSYNLRFDTADDGENRWDARKHRVANLIRFYEPAFIGTQEGLPHQLEYLAEELDGYQWIGISRDGDATSGEFSAIFYDTEKVELVEGSDKTIWLSETPSTPGKSWDAALPRILTYGQFRHRSDNTHFFVFNTHFDYRGETARVNSADLIVDTVREVVGDKPAVVTGDFNATPDSRPYAILTAEDSSLYDAFEVSTQPHLGPLFTFEGFEVRSEQEKRRLDYIFVNDKVRVRKHAIIPSFRDNRYPSDHLPVLAEINVTRTPLPYAKSAANRTEAGDRLESVTQVTQ